VKSGIILTLALNLLGWLWGLLTGGKERRIRADERAKIERKDQERAKEIRDRVDAASGDGSMYPDDRRGYRD
jgi:hypothetical protein